MRWDDLSDSGCCSGGLVITGFILQLAAAFGVVLIIIGFIGFVASEIVALKTKGKEGERVRSDGRHLQSAACPYKEGEGWMVAEGEEGAESREEGHRLL
ncbi:hypothetical protein GBAR_LOCUS31772 [Geodia barretti]|uniref:Uncharacterized protein n=1 Tax=Geodia barretti TaxID=519541 RepID=A0AA35U2R1_GEOBA|nr:hypothetical protein GBAR_LOCUS31772 [Geodia barretti]